MRRVARCSPDSDPNAPQLADWLRGFPEPCQSDHRYRDKSLVFLCRRVPPRQSAMAGIHYSFRLRRADSQSFAAESRRRAQLAGSIEALHDRTVDRESGTSELTAVGTRNQAILNKRQNLKLFPDLATVAFVDSVLCPFEQLRVPGGTVIQGIRRYATHDVVRSKAISQIG